MGGDRIVAREFAIIEFTVGETLSGEDANHVVIEMWGKVYGG